MARKITRAEFLRLSTLGVVGLATANVLPVEAKANASRDKSSDSDFHPAWKSEIKPEFHNRLSEQTREFARRSLSGEWGDAMVIEDWDTSHCWDGNPGPQTYYGRVAICNARNAPLRVEPYELLVGTATLRSAASHVVPGMGGISSVSHTTVGFERALKLGYKGLRDEIVERQKRGGLDVQGEDVLNGMLLCIDAATIWNRRYIDKMQSMLLSASSQEAEILKRNISILERVPENPPRNFREAAQCLWSMWEFNRLMGNWSGIGRIDKMLGGFLEKDLKRGEITLDEAREVIAHFWIKGTDWVRNPEDYYNLSSEYRGSGDAQFYQNIILGGIDESGRDITNEVSYLVLDVVEELHISDFPIAVRVNRRTPERFIRRMAEVQRYGGGIVSMYNEDVVIEAMTKFGYPLEDVRNFTNDGCWETIIPGKTSFLYTPKDMVAVMNRTLGTDVQEGEKANYATFDELYKAFLDNLRTDVNIVQEEIDNWTIDVNGTQPCALISLFVEGCVEKARSYHSGGPIYTVRGIHYGGLSDTANSLLVIKKLVYDEKFLTLSEFVDILRNNWNDKEALRQLVRNRFTMFGNDDDEADAMMCRVFDDYASIVNNIKDRNGILRHCAVSTFGREVDWKDNRAATAEGSRRGDILATNCSPTPGTDKKGPTSALNSYCKLDFSNMPNGGTLELKILPQSVRGENGVRALMGLTKTFMSKGGFYMHIDVVDSSLLVDAQAHPEKYPNLPVRVSGWSARFNTLCKNWQDMVIQRTQQIV